MSGIIGLLVMFATMYYCSKRYNSENVIGVITVLAMRSKYFKWLAYNIWGDDTGYYKRLEAQMNYDEKD